MSKTKRNILFFVTGFLVICLVVTSVFIISKTFSQNQKQEDVLSRCNM